MLWVDKLNFSAHELLKAHKQDGALIRPRSRKFSAILSIVLGTSSEEKLCRLINNVKCREYLLQKCSTTYSNEYLDT